MVYNHEPYLRQCLEGFVMQKTSFRFEAIVHDDASSDGSAAIIREYARKYPDIINCLPQKYIASFIGVTPEFFSKMKSNLLRKK